MQPTTPRDDGGDQRLQTSGSVNGSLLIRTLRSCICRPKFWKYLILAVILLLVVQLSLTTLFHKKYGSMLYLLSVQGRFRWKNETNSTSPNDTETSGASVCDKKELCPTVPPNLVGVLKINTTVPSIEEQESNSSKLEPGGRYRPAECRSRHRVAIIIPYRNRAYHLPVFLYHMLPILQRQQLDFAIYIVEQAGNGTFNRGKLMNVGALESLKLYSYDCFIFHDIDLLPEDDRNLYTCPQQPRHMSVAVSTLGYKLLSPDMFGGVCAMTVPQFKAVNGFSNIFWGWGGEDDDMANRVKFHGFVISRYPEPIARYLMLKHQKAVPSPGRFQRVYEGKNKLTTEGLNNLKYKVLDVKLHRQYTWILANIETA
ncbi:beta-1,4-N-acetylgalactosaminyltransferase bre-4-like [Macrobrachium nipponense]|uniref:beta-1,4-N-acetylgalactosaminyltransferase bre-4-like n=1 Tax=Macrobrachium nipponense TaxID=159736 RepID=UPI0030C7AF67